MPFETGLGRIRRRVAVVGGGISGMGAAHALAQDHDVVLFEAASRLGGHARTVDAGRDGDIPVDTGFIVYNDRNYPNLTALFAELGVPTKPSDMSFGASFDDGRLEYGLRGLGGLFAQRRNLVRPNFYRMIGDILRFNDQAGAALDDPGMSLGELLDRLKIGQACRDWYVLAFSGAIWSATPAEMLEFPARSFVRFFKNHGLLSRRGQPQWRTVDGGSRVYVERLAKALEALGGEVRVSAPVDAVFQAGGPALSVAGQAPESFDAIVLACHSDQALRLLKDPAPIQDDVLGGLRYKRNRAVLHNDPRQMPRRRACWSSWNYLGDSRVDRPAVGVTYWMNRLQSLPASQPLFVTLNPAAPIADAHIFDQTEFAHPMFDRAALSAQAALPSIQGRGGLWFCGAYTRYGFHEDGLASGLDVAGEIAAMANRELAA